MRNILRSFPATVLSLTLSSASLAAEFSTLDPDFRTFLTRFEEGTRRFLDGDPVVWKENVSRSEDVVIMGAWGAHERGWPAVSSRYDWAASRFIKSGASLHVEYLSAASSGDLAYTTAIERSRARIAGQDQQAAMQLRVTHVFRRENGAWKLMLRHADPLMEKTAPDSVLRKSDATAPEAAKDVVEFWRNAGPNLWFAKNADFDRQFRERFIALHEAASRGELATWEASAEGAMALIILLDQYPRNSFRGTRRMYDTDELARRIADRALMSGHDRAFEPGFRLFMYLPFGHSESLADQERSVALVHQLGEPSLTHALRHRDIIVRFGRFPHRNPILRREMKPEEQHYLDNGGYKG